MVDYKPQNSMKIEEANTETLEKILDDILEDQGTCREDESHIDLKERIIGELKKRKEDEPEVFHRGFRWE